MKYTALFLALGCAVAHAAEPNHRVTPGAVLPVSTAHVCTARYATGVRHVTAYQKNLVLKSYGFDPHTVDRRKWTIDHLIPLEIGGANVTQNLWPEPVEDAKRKDRLENRLRRLVCTHKLDLKTAQQSIAADWEAAYGKYLPAGK